ncbi:1-phosphofructokinase [Tyzzerella sp. An114]|uniref:1-phosphofructokinase n=1 Tax=Tyzzerella sp. An114 TaxID=1965545 RepID=UPI000B44C19D|nr:1-phosphofructokinase [Tyzzerella sp. An114]OUQ57395.1 1-phosphofructokinase [Tyzzerella sp. An114]HIT72859.1 1-phosphofructokinase [Candidatus Fimicola cottocaccae]
MIYTVTFNPSLDYIINVENLKMGETNRSSSEMILSGGKGINVSTVLKNLGFENVALGFIAGFTGKEIENGAKEFGINTDFIELREGLSRINVKIKADKETEINCTGPSISADELEMLYSKLRELKEGDILVLAGSVPPSLPQDIYEKIMEMLQNKGIKIAVDATKDLLLNVLKYNPFVIKPNNHELGEMFGVVLKTEEEIIEYAKKLQDMGARNVLISRAGDGAIMITENGEIYKSAAPKGTVVNSVGAGDSMVAGFIAGYLNNGSYEEAFKTGVATGSASAFSKYLATKEEVLEILKRL